MNTPPKPTKKAATLGLAFGALGVVYGDIGTSPLYAVNEIFLGHAKPELSHANVIGIISVVLWALIVVVAFKYVTWVLRADNEGQGGVFALLALIKKYPRRSSALLTVLLMFAAGLLFGDGMITPAISVLSAVEGLKVIAPGMASYIVPITVVILTLLFAIQKYGTTKIGKLFGPIILVWFLSIAAIGLGHIINQPEILNALNPVHAYQALQYFTLSKLMLILGSVMLVVTGGEALYADMGHFGKNPIRLSWFSIVMPCLMLNYLGQGAYLLSGKPIVENNLFFSLVPTTLLVPMVLLAAMATVIASQALISGAFSLASQGVALGLLPRLSIKHTHEHHEGQIYVPFINWSLYIGCIALVFVFGSSTRLASAYGLAVAGDMLTTSITMIFIAVLLWKWHITRALLLFIPLALIDMLFLGANSLKLFEGGFVPLTIGIVLFIVMRTWHWGKAKVRVAFLQHSTLSMGELLALKQAQPFYLERSLLILSIHNPTELEDPTPPLLELFTKRFHLLPEHVIVLTIVQTKSPKVSKKDRYHITEYENDHEGHKSLLSIKARFGFLQEPDVESVIKDIALNQDLTPDDDMHDWIIYAGRERIIVSKKSHGLAKLRANLYSFLMRNSTPAYEYYGLDEDSRISVEYVPVRVR